MGNCGGVVAGLRVVVDHGLPIHWSAVKPVATTRVRVMTGPLWRIHDIQDIVNNDNDEQ